MKIHKKQHKPCDEKTARLVKGYCEVKPSHDLNKWLPLGRSFNLWVSSSINKANSSSWPPPMGLLEDQMWAQVWKWPPTVLLWGSISTEVILCIENTSQSFLNVPLSLRMTLFLFKLLGELFLLRNLSKLSRDVLHPSTYPTQPKKQNPEFIQPVSVGRTTDHNPTRGTHGIWAQQQKDHFSKSQGRRMHWNPKAVYSSVILWALISSPPNWR